MRNLRLVWILFKLKLSRTMVFRFNFFSASFVDGSLFIMQLIVFNAIYGRMERIGDWSHAQMIVFIGTFSLLNAVNMVIYFFGINDLPAKIVSGDLDHYLTKPMNPLIRLTFEEINPGSLPLVAMSLIIICYGAARLDTPVTALNVAGYAVLVILMIVLYYDMEVIIRCAPLYAMSISTVNELEGNLLILCFRVPGTLFKGVFKVIFYFFLPYGIMSTIPTQMLTGMLTPAGFAYGVGVAVLFTWLALWLWKTGLKRYRSASS